MATRVGYAMLFCFDAIVAWISLTPGLARSIEDWTFHYVQVKCVEQETCVGVLAVHRITFALALFHLVLALLLLNVRTSRDPRAQIQNGWWGPKILALLTTVVGMFFMPSSIFVIWANYAAPMFAMSFIFLGLVLLVDFAHTWSETCLEEWERHGSDMWKYILVGTTLGLYVVVLVATVLLYIFFAPSHCPVNRALITVNLMLAVILTILCVHPRIQEANPRSGLAQSSMVLAYMTYLLASALMNRDNKQCNPIARGRGESAQTTAAVLGAIFTFVAIAYSTTRAATHSRMLLGREDGEIALDTEPVVMQTPITAPPAPKNTLRIEAIRSAVAAGSLPASFLEEELQSQQEQEHEVLAPNDDERQGTRYNYSIFHCIFALAACYVSMLLTDWQSMLHESSSSDSMTMYIGTSLASMWIRIISAWICATLYGWSLLAPALCTYKGLLVD